MNAVHLKQVKFHAHHGVYAGEEKTGGPFEVNLTVWYQSAEAVTRLDQTINYVTLFEIVKKQMQQRNQLLEAVAEAICAEIKQQFPVAEQIQISIDKNSPPIENFEGKTGITIQKTY